ncbi:MAG: hypothetical protein LBD16_06625 [Oscillospiraceae bacterium]|nr:hypothetical protein [Oscillospiraceae bacterium]
MKEWMLQRTCQQLKRRTEDAYLEGDSETVLMLSRKLDKVIYQLMLIKNRDVLSALRSAK